MDQLITAALLAAGWSNRVGLRGFPHASRNSRNELLEFSGLLWLSDWSYASYLPAARAKGAMVAWSIGVKQQTRIQVPD
jgi:hypothetical protein